jgi:hypothetical protein
MPGNGLNVALNGPKPFWNGNNERQGNFRQAKKLKAVDFAY